MTTFHAVGHRARRAITRRVTIDTRSLAAFRVALGLLLLADLVSRARNLVAFYTDAGVLSRTDLLASSDPLHLSLHVLSGDVWFQVALFLVAGASAVAMTVGYRMTVSTVVSWVLLVSLHNRNALVLNGGDFLLRLLLFWAIFLPLAERWSVDGHRSDRQRHRVASVATAALLVQVVLVYTVNAAFKLSGDLWYRGEAIAYVFDLGQFTVLLGDVLAAHPTVLAALDYLWLGMVVCSFLLIALPGWGRTAFVSLFVVMHLGMALTMRLDLFPLISIAGLLPFLPNTFWDAAETWLSGTRPIEVIRSWPARLDAVLPAVNVSAVPPALDRLRRGFTTAVPLVFLVLVVLWNLQYLGFEERYGHDPLHGDAEPLVEVTRTDQYWDMFAPEPLSVDGWVVAPGTLRNGSRVDAFHGGDVEWDRPPDVSATYPTARWRKYLVRLWRYDTANRERFAEYLCRRWNGGHDGHLRDLRNVSVYFVEQPTRLDGGPEPTERVELASVSC